MIYIVALLCCFVVIALNVLMLSGEYDHIIPIALGWVKIITPPPPIKVLSEAQNTNYKRATDINNELLRPTRYNANSMNNVSLSLNSPPRHSPSIINENSRVAIAVILGLLLILYLYLLIPNIVLFVSNVITNDTYNEIISEDPSLILSELFVPKINDNKVYDNIQKHDDGYYPRTVTVYWVTNGYVWHTTSNCPTLSRSEYIYSGTIAESRKSRECKVCG